MTDPLELLVREDLAALAARTPLAHDLAGAAVRRAQQQRRRHAIWTTAATLVVVLALGATALLAGRGAVPTPIPPAGSPSPSSQPLAFDGVLRYRGAEVPVPKAWLDPDNLVCGAPVRDAAYVPDAHGGKGICTMPTDRPAPSTLTEVTLSPMNDERGLQATYGEGNIIVDGRTQLATRIPPFNVNFVVTSPNPTLARRIFDGLVVEASVPCSGIWLTTSRGHSVHVTPVRTPQLDLQVGDTITAQTNGTCPRLSLLQQPGILTATSNAGTTPITELRAVHDGAVRLRVVYGKECDFATDPLCIGGLAGSVDVTVTAGP